MEKEKIETGDPKEKETTSRIDQEYYSSISHYFTKDINNLKILRGEDNQDENSLRHEDFLADARDSLTKMAYPERLKKMQPKDVSFALSELSNRMAIFNPDAPRNLLLEEDVRENFTKKNYLVAKEIFMESCEKIFPNAEKNLDLDEVLEQLRNQGLKISKFKEKPEELVGQIDGILERMSKAARAKALQMNREFGVEQDRWEDKLAKVTELLYKLQLMKDGLTGNISENIRKIEENKEIKELKQEVEESQEEKEKRELLEEMNKRGLLVSYTSIGLDLAKKKNSSTGFQVVFNRNGTLGKLDERDFKNTLIGSGDFDHASNLKNILEENEEGINAAVTISPFKEVMGSREVTKTSGWGPFKSTNSHYVSERVLGDGEKPIPIGEFNGNNEDEESTYKLTYLVTGNKKSRRV